MNIPRLSTTLAFLLAGAMLFAASPRPAAAQAQPTSVAVVNPLIVATQCQEYKDFQEQLQTDQANYNKTLQEKGSQLKQMSDELKLLVPGTPQYAEKNEAFDRAQIDASVWKQVKEMELARTEKTRMKALFDKIQATTAQVATKQGIALVIVDRHEDINDQTLENLKPVELQQVLLSRTILYCDIKLDITQSVIVEMDKAYNAKAP